MVRIAVAEDDAAWAGQLRQYVEQYAAQTGRSLDMTVYSDGESLVDEYHGQFDVILLDVEMRFLDGMATAELIRRTDPEVVIIFITNMAQYAIRGYEVSTLDFVIKPLAYDLFKIKMEKAIAHIRVDESFHIPVSNGIKTVRFSQIRYVESSKHYLYFHTDADTYRMRGSMRDITDTFLSNGFAAASGSLLLNLSYVEQASGSEVTVAGEHFSVARTYKNDFWNRLTVYMSGGILK